MKDYDLHLAAARISQETVKKLLQGGFERDEFANLTYCHTGDFHGTFRGTIPLPNKDLWDKICSLLADDETFSGYMEEEMTSDVWRKELTGARGDAPDYLPPVQMITCPAGRRKACDIHMSIFLDSSSTEAIEFMRRLEVASVDRPGPEGVRRVYTITCESLADGRQLFKSLYKHLSVVSNLRGRMKLEVTTKHYRKPEDAMTLPLVTSEGVAAWFDECEARGISFDEQAQPTEKRELIFA